MKLNYGSIKLEEFEEYVVKELAHRGMYASSRAGVIRAIFSEKIFNPEGVNPIRLSTEDTLDTVLDNHKAINVGSTGVGIVKHRIEYWVSTHLEELKRLGIAAEDVRKTRHPGKGRLKLV